MSATVIPLKLRGKPPLTNVRIEAIETSLANYTAGISVGTTQIQLILEDLRARQDTLLSTIESLRAPLLRKNSHLERIVADLEAVTIQTLAEVGLLIRQGTALLRRQEG